MASLNYTLAQSESDLQGIIDLQKNNLQANLTTGEILSQGFVTVIHSLSEVTTLNNIQPHVICTANGKVIAYLLAMTARSRDGIPALILMFKKFSEIIINGKPVATYQYIVVGQVCVDIGYRGKGILDKCYDLYRSNFEGRYDFAITEIATRNLRSLNAHKRIGFYEIGKYISDNVEEWTIVVWNWQKPLKA